MKNNWNNFVDAYLEEESPKYEKLFEEIDRISKIENKSISDRVVKFNEEFGEFSAELVKLLGFTYKKLNPENLVEEGADSLQVLISIIIQSFKEAGIENPHEVLKKALAKKAIKWETKIKDYTNNGKNN